MNDIIEQTNKFIMVIGFDKQNFAGQVVFPTSGFLLLEFIFGCFRRSTT